MSMNRQPVTPRARLDRNRARRLIHMLPWITLLSIVAIDQPLSRALVLSVLFTVALVFAIGFAAITIVEAAVHRRTRPSSRAE